MRRLSRFGISALMIAAVVLAYQVGCGNDPRDPFRPHAVDAPPTIPQVQIGPIDGLTTAWHPVPQLFSFPKGYELRLRCAAGPSEHVIWEGATEIERQGSWSIAACPTERIGVYEVSVSVTAQDDSPGRKGVDPTLTTTSSCTFEVIDLRVHPVRVDIVNLDRAPIALREDATNWETLLVYSAGSIAGLRQLGNAGYRTAVGTTIRVRCETSPPEFAPLTEWRLDGRPILMTNEAQYLLPDEIGTHVLSVGPPTREQRLRIDLYRTRIAAGAPQFLRVASGDVVTFQAATDPPGFENEVTWLASTRFGKARPIVGRGATFAVRFDDVVGHDNGSLTQWVGVRADNAVVTSEQTLTPVITSFTPSTISDDAAVTINGNDFPMDPSRISLEFLIPNSSFASVLDISIIDLDSDGLGERITGTAGPVPASLGGQSLPLTLKLGDGVVNAFQGSKLIHHVEGVDLAVGSTQLATFAPQATSKVVGVFNNAADTLVIDLSALDVWMANKTYGVAGTIKIKYTLAGATKECKLELKKSSVFTSDANPTAAECAQATATIYQSINNLADSAAELECKNNFEVKTEGNKVIVIKKTGSAANMIDGTSATLTFGCS